LGYFFAGLMLNWIAFPKQAKSSDVPSETMEGLGVIGGPVLMFIYLVSIVFIVFYPISKKRYEEIRAGLDGK